MKAQQRRGEIEMMIGWLEKRGLIDYVSRSSGKYAVYLVTGYKSIGTAADTHAYLSGATDVMHTIEAKAKDEG